MARRKIEFDFRQLQSREISPEFLMEQDEIFSLVRNQLDSLTSKQRVAIELRLGFVYRPGHTFEAIGNSLGVCRQEASNLYKKALKNLAYRLDIPEIRDYYFLSP